MSGIAFAIPGDIDAPTGGYGYGRQLLREWRAADVEARHLALPGGFPFPTEAVLATTECLLAAAGPDDVLLVDGLAFGAFPEALATRFEGRLVALVHHPLALETGLSPEQVMTLHDSERRALRHARAIVVTSPATAGLLAADYDVPAGRITVAVPGVAPAPRAQGSGKKAPLRLLAVGSVIPRKAHGVLVEALARLSDLDWECRIVGATDRNPAETNRVTRLIAAHGLGARVRLTGAQSPAQLAAEFHAADLFVTASLYEGYGMGLTEALARGLPLVATRAGAIPDTVPADAALLVEPGDPEALAGTLRGLIEAPERRARLAEAAWRRGRSLPTWTQTAAAVLAALKEMPR